MTFCSNFILDLDKDGAGSGGDGGESGGPPRRYRQRRGRGGYSGYGYRPYRSGPPGDDEQGDGEGSRGRGAPRRFFRRNFRGGRGVGRRPRSQDGQGQDQGGDEAIRGAPRPRYRRRGAARSRGDNSQSEPGKKVG